MRFAELSDGMQWKRMNFVMWGCLLLGCDYCAQVCYWSGDQYWTW